MTTDPHEQILARIEVEITTLADHERVFIPVTAGDQHKH